MLILAAVMKKNIFISVLFTAFSLVATPQTYKEHIEKSFECIDAEDWPCAEEAILAALHSEPGNPQNSLLLSNLGTVQRLQGKKAEAIRSYSNALMISPRSVTLLKNRAALYAEIDSLDAALADYTSAIALDAQEEDALFHRGMIYLEKNDTLAARIDFEHMLHINPGSSDARIGLATLMKFRSYHKEAVDLYSQVISYNKDDARLYFGRAESYFYMGKISKAREDMKKAIALDGSDPLFYILRSRINWAQYEKEAAYDDLEKALELGASPQSIDAVRKDFRLYDK